MKKTVSKIAFVLLATILLGSCGMKDCKCFSTSITYEYDTVRHVAADSVYNQTRGNCSEFNIDKILSLDSVRYVHHTKFCEEE